MTQVLPEETTTCEWNGHEWQVDRTGLHVDLPRPKSGRIHGASYRPVQFDACDLPLALRRAATWLQEAENWLGETVDVMAIRLDMSDDPEDPEPYGLKLLCFDEDLDGLSKTAAEAEDQRNEQIGGGNDRG
ncbi:hypothetical protein [Streptomyces abikoensis]